MTRRGEKWRLAKSELTTGRALALSVGVFVAAFAIPTAAGVGYANALGIAGAVFGLVTLAVSEHRVKAPPQKEIVVVAKSASAFNHSLHQALRTAVQGTIPGSIRLLAPESNHATEDALRFQTKALSTSAEIRSASAVVLIASGDDDDLWESVRELLGRKVPVVVLEVKPPNRFFSARGCTRPWFVTSDFAHGGRLAAEGILQLAQDASATDIIVGVGPAHSWPALERSSHLLGYLMPARPGAGVTAVAIDDYDAALGASVLASEARRCLAGRNEARLIIYCPTDKVAAQLAADLRSAAVSPDVVRTVSYDGIRNSDGSFLVAASPYAEATIDVRAEDQAAAVADILIDIYHGQGDRDGHTRIVQPTLVRVSGQSSMRDDRLAEVAALSALSRPGSG